MQGVTLTFALIASLLVITLRPHYALAVFITALLWYPSFLAVSVGTIDILVGRFVVVVLLLRCLCDAERELSYRLQRQESGRFSSLFDRA